MIPTFIINFNRLTLTRALADWCAAHNLRVIIVDNHSDYPPLLDYYNGMDHELLIMSRNMGHRVVWDRRLLDLVEVNGSRYIVTDPDLDMTGVPDDFLEVMSEGLDRYPSFSKCGLSLEISDLPNTREGQFVPRMEGQYWRKALDPMYFNAPVDTTFALYRGNVREYTHNALRTNRPYTAHHVPWYYDDMNKLPDDEKYYFRTASRSSSGKARLMSKR